MFFALPSLEYVGVGLKRICTGVVFAATLAVCLIFGAATATFSSPKPPCCTAACGGPPGPPTATPLPKPVLAITPLAPFAPPVPLPLPGPVGMSYAPWILIFAALFVFPLAGTPLGSPNPPVCTASRGFFKVGIAELPMDIGGVGSGKALATSVMSGGVSLRTAGFFTIGAVGTTGA